MKIIILSQYFYPETGAPQNRLFNLCMFLLEKGHEILVVTSMPNYPRGEIHKEYRGNLFFKEDYKGLKIYRSWLYTKNQKNNTKAFKLFLFCYDLFLNTFFIDEKIDLIICESPPIFLGITALIHKKLKGVSFYLMCQICGQNLQLNLE